MSEETPAWKLAFEARVALVPDHLMYKAVFLMGATGAGKSTLAEKKWLKFAPTDPKTRGWKYQPRETAPSRKERKGPVRYFHVVNPDDFKEEIEGYDQRAPHKVHEVSVDMADAYFDGVIETGEPLVVDGTGGALRRMTMNMTLAKDAGYNVSLVYVYVPLLVALARNLARPRSVPTRVVVTTWSLGKKNFPEIKRLADKVSVIDSTDTSDKDLIKRLLSDINAGALKDYGLEIDELLQEYDPQSLQRYRAELSSFLIDKKNPASSPRSAPQSFVPKTIIRKPLQSQKPQQQSLF